MCFHHLGFLPQFPEPKKEIDESIKQEVCKLLQLFSGSLFSETIDAQALCVSLQGWGWGLQL